MRGIFRYITEYGNLSFDEFPFNEVDALLFSHLSYLNYDFLMQPEERVRFHKIICERHADLLSFHTIFHRKNIKLIKKLENSKRYKDIYIAKYKKVFVPREFEQYFSVCFIINNIVVVTYRGTDMSFIGWKEDFDMAYAKEIPAQRDALEYIKYIYNEYKLPMILCGHSKGGNLAAYAAINCGEEIQNSIMHIYSFDGPGFYSELYNTPEFMNLKDRYTCYSTGDAIIGLLLHHYETIEFVKCSGVSILQHFALNWKITKEGLFKRVKRNNIQSRWFQRSIRVFLRATTDAERERFVNLMWQLLAESYESSLLDVKRHPFRYLRGVMYRKKYFSKEDRVFFKLMFKRLRKSFITSINHKIQEKFISMKQKKNSNA